MTANDALAMALSVMQSAGLMGIVYAFLTIGLVGAFLAILKNR